MVWSKTVLAWIVDLQCKNFADFSAKIIGNFFSIWFHSRTWFLKAFFYQLHFWGDLSCFLASLKSVITVALKKLSKYLFSFTLRYSLTRFRPVSSHQVAPDIRECGQFFFTWQDLCDVFRTVPYGEHPQKRPVTERPVTKHPVTKRQDTERPGYKTSIYQTSSYRTSRIKNVQDFSTYLLHTHIFCPTL